MTKFTDNKNKCMAKAKQVVEGELSERDKKLKLFMDSCEKNFGKGSIIKGSDDEASSYGDVIPLSSIALTEATGIGGLPKNKIVEILGWESSGKSTISNDIIAWAQKTYGDECLLIDRENSFDPFYASQLGVNLDKVELAYPDTLEDNYALIEKALDSKLFGVIVVDSLTSFEPKAAQTPSDGSKAASGMGSESRINSSKLRMVNRKVKDSNCLVVFINQIREKIGVMFGSPETTSGGNAMKFYAHMRIMIRKKDVNVEDESNVMTFKFIKNKMAPPMKEAEITIIWGKGFDIDKEVIDYAVEFGIITKENVERTKDGNTWFYGDIKLATGEDKAIEVIKDNPEMLEEIKQKVKSRLRGEEQIIETKTEEVAA